MKDGIVSHEGAPGTEAIIALGSNLGVSSDIIQHAIQRLRAFSDHPLRVSSLYQSSPVDCPPGSAAFVNAVLLLIPLSHETPESLLLKLQELEAEFGRRPKQVHNEARPLDLDLIAFGSELRTTPELTLPHPRAHRRRFVLAPLAEIEPNMKLVGHDTSIRQLLADLKSDERVARML